MFRKTLISTLATLVLALGFAGFAGCERGPAEKAGRRIDRAGERAGDEIEKAGDRIEDATDRANDNK